MADEKYEETLCYCCWKNKELLIKKDENKKDFSSFICSLQYKMIYGKSIRNSCNCILLALHGDINE